MPPPSKSRSRRLCHLALRISRTTLVVLVIVLATLAVWLNQVGLPDILRQRLVEELRSRGVEFEFSRMRLRWQRGIVAEHVNFSPAHQPSGPQFFAQRAELHLNHTALKHFKIEVDAMKLRQGKLTLPMPGTNKPAQSFSLLNIATEILFQPDARWELRNFQAQMFGVAIQLTGHLTSASFLQHWQWPQPTEEKTRPTNFWYRVLDQLANVKFTAPAELIGTIQGDARDLKSFNVNL